MRVIVTRPAAEAADWVQGLRNAGFDAVALPLIEIRPVANVAKLREAWSAIAQYRAAMFVSGNAVRGLFAARPGEVSFSPRAWAPGASTEAALRADGVPAAQIDAPPPESPRFDSEALWEVVQAQVGPGDRVLMVRGGNAEDQQAAGRDWLEQRLAERGVRVDVVVAYLRACPELAEPDRALAQEALRDGSVWLFSSSQAIGNLLSIVSRADVSQAIAVATHPRIGEAARKAGFAVVRVSRPPMDAVAADLESLG